jgi:hypothetical protein
LALVPRPFEDVDRVVDEVPRRLAERAPPPPEPVLRLVVGLVLEATAGCLRRVGEARHRVRPVAHLWNYMRESDDHPGPTGVEFAYYSIHPDDMEGTVTVEGWRPRSSGRPATGPARPAG